MNTVLMWLERLRYLLSPSYRRRVVVQAYNEGVYEGRRRLRERER